MHRILAQTTGPIARAAALPHRAWFDRRVRLRQYRAMLGSSLLRIGEVATRAGVRVQTLHFYERCGLLPKPQRSAANYRLCPPEFVRRVQFIKKAQAVGLALDEIKEVLDLKDHGKRPCRRVAELGQKRLREVEAELARLKAFRRALLAAVPDWQKETAVERVCAGVFCDLIERLP
ncbi:MAG: heavy metal-responsive transcriptional regulator [Verrucomicrobia bacterium]|nr:heavy metal-responsive transcriptional regulator [Verrucomicrobiota bacterium]